MRTRHGRDCSSTAHRRWLKPEVRHEESSANAHNRPMLAAFLIGSACIGLSPPYVSDLELARSPLIIVGHWRNLESGKPRPGQMFHGRSSLIVERVIAGSIKPGEYSFTPASDSFWDSGGKPVPAQTEYYTQLDVDNATKTNLWFLSEPKTSNGPLMLSSRTGRAVQPMSLERFYLILRADDREERIAESLQATDTITQDRKSVV